eukprot:Rmarinus@m.3336
MSFFNDPFFAPSFVFRAEPRPARDVFAMHRDFMEGAVRLLDSFAAPPHIAFRHEPVRRHSVPNRGHRSNAPQRRPEDPVILRLNEPRPSRRSRDIVPTIPAQRGAGSGVGGGVGRRNTLLREGVAPSSTPSTHATPRERKVLRRQSVDALPSPPTNKGSSVAGGRSRGIPLGSGWFQRGGCGSFRVREGPNKAKNRIMIAEAQQDESYYVVTDQSAAAVAACRAGRFAVSLQFSCKSPLPSLPALRGTPTGPQLGDSMQARFFGVVISVQKASAESPLRFVCVGVDFDEGLWRLEIHQGKEFSVIAEIPDGTLRCGEQTSLAVSVCEGHVTATSGEFVLFQDVNVGEKLCGPPGAVLYGSKTSFRSWSVEAITGLPDTSNLSPPPATPTAQRASVTPSTSHSPVSSPHSVAPESPHEDPRYAALSPKEADSKAIVPLRSQSQHNTSETNVVGISPRHVPSGRGKRVAAIRPPKQIKPPVDEDPQLVGMIERDILCRNLGITFDSIASLTEAKRLLQEAVVLPFVLPEFFTGIRQPWNGVLLFGPPGTGKTLLAKAAAAVNGTTFFNVSSSLLISKWRGESEKLVRVLFSMARHYSPSIIFFDEVDALASNRGHDEHEASRRMKTELFSQMDGIQSTTTSGTDPSRVMVLATSNCPWDLDPAMRRRLEKRIYIPLPDLPARQEILKIHLKDVKLSDDVDLARVAEKTDGFSGADIYNLCRDACMEPMRRLMGNQSIEELVKMKNQGSFDASVQMSDFETALSHTQASVSAKETTRFQDWMNEFGSR